MTKLNDIGRTLAVAAFALVFSGTCLMGAVGPASPGAAHAVVGASRLVA